MDILTRCALGLIAIISSVSVAVYAQRYDFADGEWSTVKPGLCPDPQTVDSQEIVSNCVDDVSCLGAKKCCKANTGAMLCLKADSTNGCNAQGRILQGGEYTIVDCYNCTCLNGSTLMCLSYNCSGAPQTATANPPGSCPEAVDAGECFAHLPCQQDSDCSGGQRCCDVQCGVSICIAKPHSLGSGCWNGDTYYSSGQRSNVSDSQLDCPNCLCTGDGKWHCQRHLCTTKLKSRSSAGRTRSARFLVGPLSVLAVLTLMI